MDKLPVLFPFPGYSRLMHYKKKKKKGKKKKKKKFVGKSFVQSCGPLCRKFCYSRQRVPLSGCPGGFN